MAERIRLAGPGGAGGWLESACKLILAARAGVLLLTLISLTGEGDRDLVAVLLVVAAAASFIPLRWWDRVGPALVRHPAYLAAELMLAALILLLTPVREPVLLLHARHRAARRAAVRLSGRGGVLAAARRRVRVVARRARGRRPDPRHVPDLRRPTRRCTRSSPRPARPRGGCWTARPRRSPSWPRSRAGPPAEAERARLARDMHDSLAKTVSGIGLRGAGALAPDRARPARAPRGGAPAGRGRAPGDPPGARDHRRAARRVGRVAAAHLGARDARAALGAGERRRAASSRSRRSASCTRRPRVSSSGSSARRWRTASATRARRASACGCGGSARAPC